MMETTKTGKKYYVGKRKQVPDEPERFELESAAAEFEYVTGYSIVDPEVV